MLHNRDFRSPGSTLGLAVGITLAVVTLWIAGFVVDVHSYTGAAAPEATVQAVTPSTCPLGADDPAQCPADR